MMIVGMQELHGFDWSTPLSSSYDLFEVSVRERGRVFHHAGLERPSDPLGWRRRSWRSGTSTCGDGGCGRGRRLALRGSVSGLRSGFWRHALARSLGLGGLVHAPQCLQIHQPRRENAHDLWKRNLSTSQTHFRRESGTTHAIQQPIALLASVQGRVIGFAHVFLVLSLEHLPAENWEMSSSIQIKEVIHVTHRYSFSLTIQSSCRVSTPWIFAARSLSSAIATRRQSNHERLHIKSTAMWHQVPCFTESTGSRVARST